MTGPKPGGSWTKGSVTKAVQHAYVNARVHTLNRGDRQKPLADAIAAARKAYPALVSQPDDLLEELVDEIGKDLQAAPLTINFDAWSWFRQPSTFATYAQMYERGVGRDGVMRLDDSDKKNPAIQRIFADDKATLPNAWADVQYGVGSPHRHAVTAKPAAAPTRGLAPGARGAFEIAQKMSTGLPKAQTSADGWDHYVASNPQFDPRTKQVFAALNYGRRPHGACIYYGYSHFILSDSFRRDALYFGGDTFGALLGLKVTADDQVTHDRLGFLIGRANRKLVTDIIRSCILRAHLPDTDSPLLLLEAHLFQELRLAGGIKEMHVSGRIGDKDAQGEKVTRRATAAEWLTIQANARSFAERNGVRLFFVD